MPVKVGQIKSYFESVRDDIIQLYKSAEEVERVKKIFDETEEQSKNKKILQIRKPSRIKRILARWSIRLKYGIHWKKKFFVIRLFRNYMLSFLYKIFRINKHVFRGIEFCLTYKCNFKCHHCLCARIDETEKRKELEPFEYERIVKEAMKLGALTFGLEGGEPFVHKNWEEIAKSMKPQ